MQEHGIQEPHLCLGLHLSTCPCPLYVPLIYSHTHMAYKSVTHGIQEHGVQEHLYSHTQVLLYVCEYIGLFCNTLVFLYVCGYTHLHSHTKCSYKSVTHGIQEHGIQEHVCEYKCVYSVYMSCLWHTSASYVCEYKCTRALVCGIQVRLWHTSALVHLYSHT